MYLNLQNKSVLLCQLNVIKCWWFRLGCVGMTHFIPRKKRGTHSLGKFWLGIPFQIPGFPDYWMPAESIKEIHLTVAFALNQKLQRTMCWWLGKENNTRAQDASKGDEYIQLERGYSERADEEDWAQETSQDGEPLGWSQLFTEHLHPGKDQHWQQTGQHQGGSGVHC